MYIGIREKLSRKSRLKPLIPERKAKHLAMTAEWKGMSSEKKKEYMEMLRKKFQEIEASKETPKVKSLPEGMKEGK